MINVSRGLERASAFFSFIIGFGISVLIFHRNYDSYRTLALPLDEVKTKTNKVDGKCYTYRVEDASCEIPSSS
jgi:hypothetical protein